MRHDVGLTGFAYGLRPVTLDDAEFIVQMRTSDPDRVRYLHPIPADVSQQRDWLTRYFERENDYYWVVERLATHAPEGLVGLYHVNLPDRSAEWGRWVLRSGSLAAAESALLVYRVAFDRLNLETVYCHTVAENGPVLSFHDSSGLSRNGIVKGCLQLRGRPIEVVKHLCRRADWPVVKGRLEPHARLIAQRLKRSE